MKKEITDIAIWPSSKILAIVGCVVSALYSIPFAIYAFTQNDSELGNFLLLQPIFHLILGFITAVIAFFFYNVLARFFGGIELNTSDKQ